MDKLTNNQKALVKEGMFMGFFDGSFSPYLVPLAIELSASNFMIGFLSALPYIAAIFAQIPSLIAVNYFKNYKKVVMAGYAASFICLLPLIFLPSFKEPLAVYMIFLFLYYIFSYVAQPSFIAILGLIVKRSVLGEYISYRISLMLFATLAGSFLVGIYLNMTGWMKLWRYSILFLALFIVGLLVVRYYSMLKIRDGKDIFYSFKNIFKVDKKFALYVKLSSYSNFAYLIVSPFITVYMFETLKLSYWYYAITVCVGAFTKIVTTPYWGHLADKIGDKWVMVIASFLFAITPIAYFFITVENSFLVIPLEIFAAFAVAGYNLADVNLLMDYSDKKNRVMQSAQYNVLASIPLIIAPMVGGFIVDNIKFIISGIPLILLIGGILRVFSSLMYFRQKEIRVKQSYNLDGIIAEVRKDNPINYLGTSFSQFAANNNLLRHHHKR